jgi:hypothetical protein
LFWLFKDYEFPEVRFEEKEIATVVKLCPRLFKEAL